MAGARGAPDAAAELAWHAARLTPAADPAARLARLSDQVDHLVRAGNETGAGLVVAEVLAGEPRGAVRVRALVHSALLARDPATAVARLEEAALEETGDPVLVAGTLAQLSWQRGAWSTTSTPPTPRPFVPWRSRRPQPISARWSRR